MNGTILIVDDDDDTAVLLRDSLRKRGFAVDAVNSAQQCLEYLRTDPADVVVTDVQMSGMSGIELCQELRQRYPDLLPLVLTGQGGLDTAIGGGSQNADAAWSHRNARDLMGQDWAAPTPKGELRAFDASSAVVLFQQLRGR